MAWSHHRVWLIHLLGIDTQQSWAYDFWSGSGAKLMPNATEVLLGYVWYRHNQCHVKRCWWLGKHQVDGTPICTRHHPDLET